MSAPRPPADSSPSILAALGAQEWLVALAGLTSLALLIAASLDFGDPIERAQLEVEKAARVRADLVEVSYEKLLGRAAAPVPALGRAVTIGIEMPWLDAERPASSASDRIVPVLIESGLFEAAAGDMEAAVREMEGVLARASEDARALEARLHLARWAAKRGDSEAVRQQRAAILDALPHSCSVEGTSVALLATLVEPVDAGAASVLLAEPILHLPRPEDRATLGAFGIDVQFDPWWTELRGRLEGADPAVDWDRLFRVRERAGAAVAKRVQPQLTASADAWTLQRREGVLLAARERGAGGTEVMALRGEELAAAVVDELPQPSIEPYEIVVGGVYAGESVEVLGPRTLGPDAFSFSVRTIDPLRAGRRELYFLRVVRASLVALALGILVTTVLSARATARSRRLSQLRSTFVASVSHDLRTPIQSMLLMSETLEQNRVASEAGRKRYFGSIRREAQRLRRLVEDLLDGARIDRGEGARVERQHVETERYLDELKGLMQERAERADGELNFVLGTLPARLHVDPDGLHRVAWNLFENALKYGRQDGETARVTISFAAEGDVLFVQVDDEGPGVPKRFAESLFQPFERASAHSDGGEVEKDTGTGLGLSIVRAITRAHGGDARLVLNSGDASGPSGARFVATFASVLTQPH